MRKKKIRINIRITNAYYWALDVESDYETFLIQHFCDAAYFDLAHRPRDTVFTGASAFLEPGRLQHCDERTCFRLRIEILRRESILAGIELKANRNFFGARVLARQRE